MIWWRKKQSQDRERSNAPKVVSLPEHITHVYAIGDVHGMKDLATKAEAAIAVDPSFSSDTSLILYLGDLVDRGPDTAFLLDWITVPSKIGAKRMFLRGNHEEMMEAFLSDPTAHLNWLDFGGLETLNSYGILERPDKMRRMKEKDLLAILDTSISSGHRSFLGNLVDAVEAKNFFFAHAGVVPNTPLDQQTKEDLLWSRDRFMAHKGGFQKTIVHGHTPVEEPMHDLDRVSVDTGAYVTGRLSVAKISIVEETVEFIVVTRTHD